MVALNSRPLASRDAGRDPEHGAALRHRLVSIQRPLIEATLQRNEPAIDLHMDVLSFQLRIEPEDDYQSARFAVAIQVESNAKGPTRRRRRSCGADRGRGARDRERRRRCRQEGPGLGLEDQGKCRDRGRRESRSGPTPGPCIYDELGFTSEKHKASLDYLLTLMASSSKRAAVALFHGQGQDHPATYV